MNPHIDSAVHFAFAVLVNGLWEAALIAIACAVILRLTPHGNATTRSSVLTAALLTSVVLPIATAFVSAERPAARMAGDTTAARPSIVTHPARVAPAPVHRVAATTSAVTAAERSFALPRLRLQLPRTLVFVLVGVWLVAAAVAMTRLIVSLIHLERLKRDALPLPVEYRSRLDRWARAGKGARGLRLCRSPEISIPIAVGLFDAMILVPEKLIEELSPEDIDRIVLHELAHLRRGDDWVNAIERIAQALFFFNPGVLWIVGQLDLEREVVCDDWVLDQTAEIRQYATCLARVAEITAWPYRAMAAPGAFVTRRSMSVRIERLLQAGRDTRTRTSMGPAGTAVAAFAALCVVAAYVTPSFADTAVAPPRASKPATPHAPAAIAVHIPAALGAPAVQRAKTIAFARQPQERAQSRDALEADSQSYIDDLAAAGYRNLSIDQLIQLKSLGVTGDFIRRIEAAGIPHPSVEEIVQMASLGIDPAYVRQMRTFFPKVDVGQVAGLRSLGVTSEYLSGLRSAGFDRFTPDEVDGLKTLGVDGAYVRSLSAAGYPNLSVDDLSKLRTIGIDGDFIRRAAAHGFHNLSIEQLVKLKVSGIL